jgi:hypothetical protein
MRVPRRVLDRVRGPVLAAAVIGCSSSSPTTEAPVTRPVQPTEPVSTAHADPVSYDATAEAERLARTDALLAANETRRDERIAGEDAARRRRRSEARRRRPPRIIDLQPLCGRG